MYKLFETVILSKAKNLSLSDGDCHVAPLLAMTITKEALNFRREYIFRQDVN